MDTTMIISSAATEVTICMRYYIIFLLSGMVYPRLLKRELEEWHGKDEQDALLSVT